MMEKAFESLCILLLCLMKLKGEHDHWQRSVPALAFLSCGMIVFITMKKDKKIVVAFSDRSCCACVGLAPSVADVLALA